MQPERPRSNFWFLLPIVIGLIGGIIAYFILRHDDPRKAKNCLYLGIALAVVGIGLNFLFAAQLGDIGQDLGFAVNV